MKLRHISLTAKDADRLAAFYRTVFGYKDRRPPTILSGDKVSKGNGLPNAHIYSIWLDLPDAEEPFLEILEYKHTENRPQPRVNENGLGHLAFEVLNIQKTLTEIIDQGGTALGEITNFGTQARPYQIIYVRDPEGNILELEQP
jgi:catechol 2,3-dioxygenase-like lactoylglutathione lyase family enzyme